MTDRLWWTLTYNSDVLCKDSKSQFKCIVQFNRAVKSTKLVAGAIDVTQKVKESVELLLREKQ